MCKHTQWLYISGVPENVLNIYVILNQLLSTIHYFVIKEAACISKRIILSIVQFVVQNSTPIKAFYFSYTKLKIKSPQTHNFSNTLPHRHSPSFPILFFFFPKTPVSLFNIFYCQFNRKGLRL